MNSSVPGSQGLHEELAALRRFANLAVFENNLAGFDHVARVAEHPGDIVVVLAGSPQAGPGHTDSVRVVRVSASLVPAGSDLELTYAGETETEREISLSTSIQDLTPQAQALRPRVSVALARHWSTWASRSESSDWAM